MTCEFKWVLTCAALALGEGCGFAVTDLSHAWPVVAAVALFAVTIGYGLDWRPWPYLAVFLLGVVLLSAVLFIPVMEGLFSVSPLTGYQIGMIGLLAVIPTVIIQMVKVVRENLGVSRK